MYSIKDIRANFQYIIFGLIFYLSSFRTVSVSELALTYSVPDYILIIQTFSPVIVFVAMTIALIKRIIVNNFIANKKALLYYYIFSLLIIFFSLLNEIDFSEFLGRFIFLTLIYLYFSLVVAKLENIEKAIQGMFLGMFAFIITNLAVIILDIGSVFWKGRLFGLTGHPNFMGICGTLVVITAGFFFFIRRNFSSKVFYLCALGCGLWICILTGSRNSVITSLLFFLNYIFFSIKDKRLRFFLFYISGLIAILFFNYFTIDNLDYAGRGNTRAETWAQLWQQASELPLVGIGKTGITSNSYLFAVVATGVFGSLFLLLSIIELLKIFKFQGKNVVNQHVLVFRKSAIVALLFAALFEGFLLDNISAAVFTFWFLLAVNIKKKYPHLKKLKIHTVI